MTVDVTSSGVIARNANHFRFAGHQPNSDMLTDSPQRLWDTAIPQAQKRIDDPIVWLAMQSARALIVEQDTLILAVPAEVEYLAACLNEDKNQSIFVEILTSLMQKPTRIRVILGETLEDWDKIREQEGMTSFPPPTFSPPAGPREPTLPPGGVGARESTFPPGALGQKDVGFAPPPDDSATRRLNREATGLTEERTEERRTGAWDSTLERISRGLNTTPLKQYPQGRAHYFINSIRLISEAMDRMIDEAGGVRTDLFERGVSRAIDRLAQAVEFDPLLVALELEKYREAHRKGIGDYTEAIQHAGNEP